MNAELTTETWESQWDQKREVTLWCQQNEKKNEELEHQGKNKWQKVRRTEKKTDQRVKGGKLKTLNDKGQVREMHLGKDEQTWQQNKWNSKSENMNKTERPKKNGGLYVQGVKEAERFMNSTEEFVQIKQEKICI